jgi:hypothetical protein
MPVRACAVTFTDSRGSLHTVDVSAESLFEAAVLGVAALRRSGFMEEAPGPGTRLQIEVREPVARHTVSVQQVQRWLDEWGTNPSR